MNKEFTARPRLFRMNRAALGKDITSSEQQREAAGQYPDYDIHGTSFQAWPPHALPKSPVSPL